MKYSCHGKRQVTGEGETYRLLPNEDMFVLIAPAWA
jgi:hypothetical protein